MSPPLSKSIELQLAALSEEERAESERDFEILHCHNKGMLRNEGLALYNCVIIDVEDRKWTIKSVDTNSFFKRGNPVLIEFSSFSIKGRIISATTTSIVFVPFNCNDSDDSDDIIALQQHKTTTMMIKPSTPIKRILKIANPISIKRQKDSLKNLLKKKEEMTLIDPANLIISLLYDDFSEENQKYILNSAYIPPIALAAEKFDLKDHETLNTEQNKILEFWSNGTLCSSPENQSLLLLHGPPGTGKTECLIKFIECISNSKKKDSLRILVCGPSNQSVDNVLERSNLPFKIRMGNSSRIGDNSLKWSLDSHLERENGYHPLEEMRLELIKLTKKEGNVNWGTMKEIRLLRQEIRKRKILLENSFKDKIKNTKKCVSIFSTLNSVLSSTFEGIFCDVKFDIAIIDEAAQSIEAETWIAILKSSGAVILSGDHKQLPPTTLTDSSLLKESLFEKIIRNGGNKARAGAGGYQLITLKRQYRMNNVIMNWASKEMYESGLEADSSVDGHLLSDLIGVKDSENTRVPFVLYDTTGFESSYREIGGDDGVYSKCISESKSNLGEAKLLTRYCRSLLKDGVLPEMIGIITPYSSQVKLIINELGNDANGIEIGTVDGFQGREKEAILISFVRCNDEYNIGFMEEIRRTNVAITRSRRHCCIIANCVTFERNPFYCRLFDYIGEEGELRFPEN